MCARITTAPKTVTFQMRINPEIKREAEDLFASCGMTLTEAVNTFIQQSLNVRGLPFLVTQNSKESLRLQAAALLSAELQKGEQSVNSDDDWISASAMRKKLGV